MITFIWNWWDIRCKYIMLAETIYDPRASKGKTFKSLVAWKRSLPRPKFFFENLSPPSTHIPSYTITKKPKRVNLRRQNQWGSWSSWGSLLIALSLDFPIIRILFRFLIEGILFRVLRDRAFFFRVRSNRFFSSSMLFFRHVAIFLSNRVTILFYQKQMFCFAFIIILKNN